MDYGTVNAEENAEEYQDELTVEESRDQWAKRHWSLLALKELQVEMKFQDQAIGQRGQRLITEALVSAKLEERWDLIDAADCGSFWNLWNNQSSKRIGTKTMAD